MSSIIARSRALIGQLGTASQRELAATLLGAIAVSGSLIGFGTYALPHPEGTEFVAPAFAFAASLAAGFALWRGRRTAPWWAIGVVVALGSVVITVAMVSVPERTGAYSPYYVLIGTFAFYFLRARWALVQVGLVGILYAAALMIEEPPGPAEQWVNGVGITLLVGLLVWALRMRIHGLVEELRRLADTDSLTGLPNRRAFDQRLTEEVARCGDADLELALVLVDLNRFKELNDTAGHLAGDAALARMGEIISHAIRDQDWVARFGGDEFAVLLPGASDEVAERVAGRIRSAVATAFAGDQTELTASVGVGWLTPAGEPALGSDARALLEQADRSLYAEKRPFERDPRSARLEDGSHR